jgi:hypothetical protein
MFGSRLTDKKTKNYPRLSIPKDTFDFVKNLKVGDKGTLAFAGIIKLHQKEDNPDASVEENESKSIKLTNLKLANKNVRTE